VVMVKEVQLACFKQTKAPRGQKVHGYLAETGVRGQ
jgi:hypothetical protein